MANPQIEEGYVRIATEIQDAFCRTRIPGEERQVLDVIIRKTYGWNKCEDAISLSQFAEMTGIVKTHIPRAIKGLIAKNMITVTKKGYGVTNIGYSNTQVFKFNKNYEEWMPLPKKVTLPKKVIGITKNGYEPLPKKVTTINNIINTITKDNSFYNNYVATPEAIRLAELLYSEIIKQNSKSRLVGQNATARDKTITAWARDIDKLIGIDQQEPSTVEEVIFFATHDDFWGANILSGKKLREKWDTLTMKMKQKGRKYGNTKSPEIDPFSDIPKSMRGNW